MRRAEFIREAERLGWRVDLTNGNHLALSHPAASETIFTSGTPSDWRSWENVRAQMRRALPPEPRPERPVEPRVKRTPRPRVERPALRTYGEPLLVHRIAGPERRIYPDEPAPARRLPGGPGCLRSCLDRI